MSLWKGLVAIVAVAGIGIYFFATPPKKNEPSSPMTLSERTQADLSTRLHFAQAQVKRYCARGKDRWDTAALPPATLRAVEKDSFAQTVRAICDGASEAVELLGKANSVGDLAGAYSYSAFMRSTDAERSDLYAAKQVGPFVSKITCLASRATLQERAPDVAATACQAYLSHPQGTLMP